MRYFSAKEQRENAQAEPDTPIAPSLDLSKVQDSSSNFYLGDKLLDSSCPPTERRHHRAIRNAEIFSKKGRLEQAIRIYKSLHQRVDHSELKEKIEANINYLKEAQSERIDGGAPNTEASFASVLPRKERELERRGRSLKEFLKDTESRKQALKKRIPPIQKETSLPKETDPLSVKSQKTSESEVKEENKVEDSKDPKEAPASTKPKASFAPPIKQAPSPEQNKIEKEKKKAVWKPANNEKIIQKLIDQIKQRLPLKPSSMILKTESENLEPLDLPKAERPKLLSQTQIPPIIVSPDMRASSISSDQSSEKTNQEEGWQELSGSSDDLLTPTQETKPILIVERQSPAFLEQPAQPKASMDPPASLEQPAQAKVSMDSPASLKQPAQSKEAMDSPASLKQPAQVKVSMDSPASLEQPAQPKASMNPIASLEQPAQAKASMDPPASLEQPAQPKASMDSTASLKQPAQVKVSMDSPASLEQPAQAKGSMDPPASLEQPAQDKVEQMGPAKKSIGEKIVISEKVSLLPVNMPAADLTDTDKKDISRASLLAPTEKQAREQSKLSSGSQRSTKDVFSDLLSRIREKKKGEEQETRPQSQSSEKLEQGRAEQGKATDPYPSQDKKEISKSKKNLRSKKADSLSENPQAELKASIDIKRAEKKESPFFVLSYDFTKIPDTSKFNKKNLEMGYAYQRYRSMLVKAQNFTRRKMLQKALNYYEVIVTQDIPEELRQMIHKNIADINSYLKKSLYY